MIRALVRTRPTQTQAAVAAPTVINAPSPAPPPPSPCYADFRAFITDLEASTEYTDWCTANPGGCSTWTTYANKILAGGSPSPPSMSDSFGTGLVDAGVIALDGIIPCRAKPPPIRTPHAAFTFAVSGLTVSFTNLSTVGASGALDSWRWTFGDGDTDTTDWSPSHEYVAPGTYIVTLTIVGSGGDGISTVRHLVTVFVPSAGPAFHVDAVTV